MNKYPQKFYQDLTLWLEQWLETNVHVENDLPYEIELKRVVVIIISVFYRYIKLQFKRGAIRLTAGIFEVSARKISRAIKKDSN